MNLALGVADPPHDDAAGEAQRAAARQRRIAVNVAVAALAKIASFAINLLLIPILLGYLGGERFGVWATITSFVMLLTFADLGVGNGLMTAIARASARGDNAELRRLATAGFAATSGSAGALAAFTFLLVPLIPWGALLNAPSTEVDEIAASAIILGLSLAIGMPANVASRIETGLQRGFVANCVQLAGAVAAGIATIAAIRLGAGLPWLVATSVGVPALVAIGNSVAFFGFARPDLRPSRAAFAWADVRGLLRLGSLFLVLQMAISFSASSDNLVISHIMGPEAVTQYTVPARLYALISAGIALALTPLWPAYGEAMSRGDHRWVRKTLLKTMAMSLGVSLTAGILLTFCLPFILQAWVGSRVHSSMGLMVAMSFATAFDSFRTSVAMFLNGAAVVRFQLIVDISYALVCIAARILLVSSFGLIGIPLGSVIAFLATVLGPHLWYLGRRFATDLAPESA